MVRSAVVIACIAAIAVVMVCVRREEARARPEIHNAHVRQVALRRRLWDQRVRIGHMAAPDELRKRVRELALDLTGEEESRWRLARRSAQSGGRLAQLDASRRRDRR